MGLTRGFLHFEFGKQKNGKAKTGIEPIDN